MKLLKSIFKLTLLKTFKLKNILNIETRYYQLYRIHEFLRASQKEEGDQQISYISVAGLIHQYINIHCHKYFNIYNQFIQDNQQTIIGNGKSTYRELYYSENKKCLLKVDNDINSEMRVECCFKENRGVQKFSTCSSRSPKINYKMQQCFRI